MEETELLSTPVYTGTIGDHRVVLMRCGMGKVSAGKTRFLSALSEQCLTQLTETAA